MAVGAGVELAPLADALPDSLADDGSEASDIIVTSSAALQDSARKMDPEHDVPAAGATTFQQLRHEAVRLVHPVPVAPHAHAKDCCVKCGTIAASEA